MAKSPDAVPRLDPAKHDMLAEALATMSSDEAQFLLGKLTASLQRRKYQLIGYLAAAVAGFLGMVVVLVVYATRDPGQFVGWAFVVPFAGIGLSLFVFGRLADRAGANALPARTSSPHPPGPTARSPESQP